MKRERKFSFPVTTLAGSRFPNILQHLKKHRVEKKYFPKLILSMMVSGIFEIPAYYEKKKWGRAVREYRMKSSPVFIIGFWRSGTTLLHNLMCQDPRAGYTTTLQTVFPHVFLSQKKILKKLYAFIGPEHRPFDKMKMGSDLPQEEEYGLTNVSQHSLYNMLLFPADLEEIIDEAINFENAGSEQVRKWKEQYREFVSKSMIHTKGVRYIGKNPCNLFRVNIIKEIYPDARFIFIHRSPYQVIESLYRFFLSVFPGVQLQDLTPAYSREKIVLLYRRIMESYLSVRNRLHPCDLIDIRMDDFLKDKSETLRRIYHRFGIPGFDKSLPYFEKYLAENPSPENHAYKVDPETVRLVNLHASSIVRRLGYQLMREKQDDEVREVVVQKV